MFSQFSILEKFFGFKKGNRSRDYQIFHNRLHSDIVA